MTRLIPKGLLAEWGDILVGVMRGELNKGSGLSSPHRIDADRLIEPCGHDALVIGKIAPSNG